MGEFTHFDSNGNAVMVDVSEKPVTSRTAVAKGSIQVSAEIIAAIVGHTVKKGDVLGVAAVAGILGAKGTSSLIPMCHPLSISKCGIDFEIDKINQVITAVCTVKVDGKTGVEMEALTGVSIALLTIYDMCKAIDKQMKLTDIHLVEKSGGKSGDFCWGGDK
jgi:molybdenum cofactor biosynthesis protein MoaC